MLRPYFDFDRNALNPELATEIRLHQHTDGPSTELRGQPAARRPDAALPTECDGTAPGADSPFGDWTVCCSAYRIQHVSFGDRSRADVVQEAVIRLADDRVGGANIFVAGKCEQPGEDGIGGARDAQRARKYD